MPSNRVVRVRSVEDGVAAVELREGIARIQSELAVTPEFPQEVERAAAAAARAPRLPDLDRTDIAFVTIDPPGSRDLDQALHIEREGAGYVVRYAIADVAAFVSAGDPVDLEANRRGETLYGADSTIPLHPKVLSEDAASLLPDQVRPALLWTIKMTAQGERTDVNVERALVRSRARLSYDEAQRAIDDGTATGTLPLLKEVGEVRMAREAARGGVSLPLPEQDVDVAGDRWHLEFRKLLPVEQWNAQISLLTGFAAASLMVYARVGLLRTLPPPDPHDVQRLHRTARALQIEWPAEQLYPDFIRALESEYAHVTAPLRRLGDRYAGEVCVALCAGTDVPAWTLAALPTVPKTLQASSQRARAYERAVLDLVEAGVLQDRVGENFGGVVVDIDDKDERRGVVVLDDPDVEARLVGAERLPLGTDVRVTLAAADVATRKIEFTLP